MGGASSVSTQFAEGLAGFRLREVPREVVTHAKLILLDTLGAMLAASAPKYSATRILVDFAKRLGGRPESSLVGQRLKTNCVTAALVNGTLGYYCDIEPHHVGGILHAPAVVVPTALAVAEKEGASGARFLEAMILGIEVTCRVSYALNPTALYNRGFHPSAICGAFGAAAAASRLFRLSPPKFGIALGLAMQQASGLLAWASDHTENSRPFNPGLAARNGTTAAYLAQLGFGGPPTPFEGKYDAFTAFTGERHPEALLADWGKHYYLPEFAYKLYSSCSFTHPGLDALLALARDHQLRSTDVQEIVLRFPRSGAHMIDDNELKSHCAQYILPVGLVFGRVMIDDILQDRMRHPEVARLRARTRMVADAELDKGWPEIYASIVEVTLPDGRKLSRQVDHAKGNRENPLTPEEIREKYLRLATTVTTDDHAEQIAAVVQRIDRTPEIASLAGLLRSPSKPATSTRGRAGSGRGRSSIKAGGGR
ncbi:MAG TPA: MmgE/PrpD family protein [Candidatus Methylomirabilis sp.]|nr:MmgE/PrpD family protein [Candidatus Methylomirabilis sp.]